MGTDGLETPIRALPRDPWLNEPPQNNEHRTRRTWLKLVLAMNQEEQQLYERVAAFEFDEPAAALTFAARLARENGWLESFAERVIEDYHRGPILERRLAQPRGRPLACRFARSACAAQRGGTWPGSQPARRRPRVGHGAIRHDSHRRRTA